MSLSYINNDVVSTNRNHVSITNTEGKNQSIGTQIYKGPFKCYITQ